MDANLFSRAPNPPEVAQPCLSRSKRHDQTRPILQPHTRARPAIHTGTNTHPNLPSARWRRKALHCQRHRFQFNAIPLHCALWQIEHAKFRNFETKKWIISPFFFRSATLAGQKLYPRAGDDRGLTYSNRAVQIQVGLELPDFLLQVSGLFSFGSSVFTYGGGTVSKKDKIQVPARRSTKVQTLFQLQEKRSNRIPTVSNKKRPTQISTVNKKDKADFT